MTLPDRNAALITGLSSLCDKLSDPSVSLSLEEMQKAERAILSLHVANLGRLAQIEREVLLALEVAA